MMTSSAIRLVWVKQRRTRSDHLFTDRILSRSLELLASHDLEHDHVTSLGTIDLESVAARCADPNL